MRKSIFSTSNISLEHYDNKLKQIKSVELDLSSNNARRTYEFIIELNNTLFLYSSFKNQKDKKNYLFVQTINKTNLKLNDDLKKIAEIDYSNNSKNNAGNYNFKLSRKKSKVLIYYNLPFDKKENERFGLHVFDSKMNQLWEKEIILPYEEKLFSVEDYDVDSNGNVHLLGIVYDEKVKVSRKGKPNYKYHILSYHNSGNDLREYTANIGGKFLTDMQIAINDNNDIICAGFYSNEGTVSIMGSYFLKIDFKTREVITKSFKEFDLDFITQNFTERQEERAKKRADKGHNVEMYQFDLDDIILKDDGGAVLIGEQYYVRTVTTQTGNGTTTTTYNYFFNDIIAVSMNPDGSIDWAKKIPKRQITSNDGGFYSSYYLAVYKDRLNFIFNDNIRNISDPDPTRVWPFTGRKGIVVMVELNSRGEMTKQPLFASKEMGTIIRPVVAEQISQNEVILFGQWKKNQRFARVLFK
ncbi:MAG: hypothetical protein OEW75_10665 [Cyclobacteriaceae bacterium]|nr:hypothetical protein [Cyclobacteriaceae bacterium]